MWIVEGGIYEDFTWTTLVPGTSERLGPFPTYEEARQAWEGRARFMVDTACHRLFVRLVPVRRAHVILACEAIEDLLKLSGAGITIERVTADEFDGTIRLDLTGDGLPETCLSYRDAVRLRYTAQEKDGPHQEVSLDISPVRAI